MNDNEIKDRIRKGGVGSGKRGHMGVTPSKSVREANRQKAGDVLQSSREAKRIIAELDLGKEDLREIRDLASAEGISPSQFIVNNKDHIKTNLKKGGVGSGRRGHKTANYGGVEGGLFGGKPQQLSSNPASKESLASDKKVARKYAKDDSHEELQNKINSHKELSESKHLSQASRDGYAAKHKVLLAVQKKRAKNAPEPKQEGSSLPGPFGNIARKSEDLLSLWEELNTLEKLLPLAGAKTAVRVVQNAVKPASAGEGSDKVPGGPGGPSAASGGGTGKQSKGSGKKMSKGGIGSGKRGHHTFSSDGEEHDSVFEDSKYDSTQEKLSHIDKIRAAADRMEEDYKRQDKTKGSKRPTSSISRKPKKEKEKPSLFHRIGQKLIDLV